MALRDLLATARHLVPRVLLGIVLLGTAAWCVGAIWFSEIGPGWARWTAIAVLLLSFPLAVLRGAEIRHAVVVFVAVFLALVALFHLRPAGAEPQLGPRHAARAAGRDRRRFGHRAERPQQPLPQRGGLRTCAGRRAGTTSRGSQRLDFMVERFHPSDAPAHTFLSFGFEDGEQVCVSVEIRRERGESFAPLRALYRQYELLYVVADERDVLLLRTNHRKGGRVFLFPGPHDEGTHPQGVPFDAATRRQARARTGVLQHRHEHVHHQHRLARQPDRAGPRADEPRRPAAGLRGTAGVRARPGRPRAAVG